MATQTQRCVPRFTPSSSRWEPPEEWSGSLEGLGNRLTRINQFLSDTPSTEGGLVKEFTFFLPQTIRTKKAGAQPTICTNCVFLLSPHHGTLGRTVVNFPRLGAPGVPILQAGTSLRSSELETWVCITTSLDTTERPIQGAALCTSDDLQSGWWFVQTTGRAHPLSAIPVEQPVEDERPQPEFTWSKALYKARKAAQEFSKETHADY